MNRQLSFGVVAILLTTATACSSSDKPSFTVTVHSEHASFSPADPVSVAQGGTATFDVSADENFQLVTRVGGDCPQGEWSDGKYTTGAITANCTVFFSAASAVAHVFATGTGVDVEPKGTQTVAFGSTLDFDVVVLTGYKRDEAVGGSCAQGTWSGDTYTTGPITGDCTLQFSGSLKSFDVTSSGTNVTLSPTGVQKVLYGSTQSWAVTTPVGYTRSNTVGGTCPAGTWSGNSYTTGVIKSACSVSFSATLNAYQVITTGSHVTIAPTGTRTVNHGSMLEFTVAADDHYTLSATVGGTCPAGSWAGNVYTTGVIIGECSVSFGADLNTYLVTSSGDHVTISPTGAQLAGYGSTLEFTVTPDTGFTRQDDVGGTCPAGTWNGNVYTTGTIVGACDVSFVARLAVTITGTNVGRSPDGVQYVSSGATVAVTVIPDAGYQPQAAVGGTCPAGSWTGMTYTTGAITAACTVSFSARTVFVFNGGIYHGSAIGDRAAAAAKCQASHDDVPRGFSNLACNHYVPLLGYAPNGITDLTQTPYSIPTNRKIVGPGGVLIANDWNTLINLSTGVNDILNAADVLNGSAGNNSYFAWTGFTTGGVVTADTCSGWSSPSADGSWIISNFNSGWSHTTGNCSAYILSLMCMCWHD